MTPEQRAAAERLIDPKLDMNAAQWIKEVYPLLRELAAEPAQKPVAAELPAPQLLVESAQGFVEGWTRSQVRSAINLALLKQRYAHPPQQRKPLTDEQIKRCVDEAHGRGLNVVDQLSDFTIKVARAIERAHGITGEPT
jgi:hypothetical protein